MGKADLFALIPARNAETPIPRISQDAYFNINKHFTLLKYQGMLLWVSECSESLEARRMDSMMQILDIYLFIEFVSATNCQLTLS